MTAPLFPETAPPAGPRVTITARPKGQGDPVLSLGRFDTPLGRVVAMGRGGALWGLGFAGELSARQVEEDLLARWPWMTMKVLLGIYWQALRLFIKRTPIFTHPESR